MTKDGKVHNFRTTPHSFFLECMKRKTIKQQIRCFSIGPSYEEAFWKPDTKEELDKLENNHMIVAEYDIAAPFSESSEYEQRTFYLFELLRVLKSCVMTEREDDFSIVLRDPIITMDELKQYLFDPENRESNQTCIDIKKSIEVEEYRPGDYDEGFSFEAKVNKVLVAIGKELPRDDDTEFVAFGFEIFINNLLGITEEKKYQGASTWATDKKVIITIPPECFPLKVLDVARNLRKKDFFAEVIPCYEVMPKFDDNIEVVGYNESEFSEQINRAKVKVTKEKKTAAAKRIAIEKTEPYDIIIDPHLEDEGLKKEDVFKQAESKFKYLYYKDVTIAAVNYEAKDLKQGIYSNQIKVDYLLKTKDIKRTVIFITYPTNEDGSKNFDKPDFFLWVNHNFCITQKPQPSAQKTERKKK